MTAHIGYHRGRLDGHHVFANFNSLGPSEGEGPRLVSGTFVYDGWNPILETIVSHVAGTTNAVRYLWGLDLSETLQGAGGVGGLVAIIRDGAAYFPCYDANGNITEYVSESGAVVASYVYDAFGNLLFAADPMADVFFHRFSTKYFDPETGLYYYGYRFYSPEWGRWINRDPLEEYMYNALYCFVENAPTYKIDLFGLFSSATDSDAIPNHKSLNSLGPPLLTKLIPRIGCCNNRLYNLMTECCLDGQIRSRFARTDVFLCCSYGSHPFGLPDHCWVEYPSGAHGLYPQGVIDESVAKLRTDKRCTPIFLSECEYDIKAFTTCMETVDDGQKYVLGFHDCRHWSRNAIQICKEAARK